MIGACIHRSGRLCYISLGSSVGSDLVKRLKWKSLERGDKGNGEREDEL
jgi:hypothetical protein